MTSQKYRRQGLIRKIMEQIDADYKGKIDGIYLFANDTVLEFYPKFGFEKTNEWLIMFYVTKFMQENVYFHKESDTYVIAEIGNGNAFIHNIFSSTLTELEKIVELLGKDVKKITLGFTPMNESDFEHVEHKEKDCTFFIKGEALKLIEKEKMRIPTLVHA